MTMASKESLDRLATLKAEVALKEEEFARMSAELDAETKACDAALNELREMFSKVPTDENGMLKVSEAFKQVCSLTKNWDTTMENFEFMKRVAARGQKLMIEERNKAPEDFAYYKSIGEAYEKTKDFPNSEIGKKIIQELVKEKKDKEEKLIKLESLEEGGKSVEEKVVKKAKLIKEEEVSE